MKTEVEASFLSPAESTTTQKNVLAWINYLNTGQPVENAQVSLWHANRKVRVKIVT